MDSRTPILSLKPHRLHARASRAIITLLVLPMAIPPGIAQTPSLPLSTQDRQRTDGGAIAESQRRADEKPPVSRANGKTVVKANTPKVDRSMAGVRMAVQGFRFEGDVAGVSAAAIEQVLAPWKGRDLTFAEYEQALHAVGKFLRENGHPNAEVRVSRAQVKENTIAVAIQGLTPGTFTPAPLAAQDAAKPVEPSIARVFVREFRVSGTDILTQADINQQLTAYTNRSLTIQELDEATTLIAATYRSRGFGLAQAFMPPQRIDDGLVDVTVQPGIVDKAAGNGGLTVSGAGQIVKPSVIESIVARAVKGGDALNTAQLEQTLRVASDVPGITSVKADIAAGTQPGTTQVTARVEESRRVAGTIWADNHGSRYVGSSRLSGQFNLNSPSGNGEQYNLQFTRATGTRSLKIGGSGLVAPNGARAGASFSRMSLDIGQEIAPLNLNSESTVKSLFGSYPIRRSATSNITLDANLDFKHFANNLAGIRDNNRRVNVLTTGLSGDLLDGLGGQIAWGTQLAFGRVDLSETPAYQIVDTATARTEGGFTKLNFNLGRLASLPESIGSSRFSLYTAVSGQIGNRNLDSAEKFQLGGPTGVRAYPVGEGLGDRGWLATAELRYNMPTSGAFSAQLFGFIDAGGLQQYSQPWATALAAGRPNAYSLAGAGFGVTVSRSDVGSVKIMYAKKLGTNPNPTVNNTDSDGQNKSGRILILGTISF